MRFSAVIYKDSGEVVSTVQNATALSMEGKTFIEAVVWRAGRLLRWWWRATREGRASVKRAFF